MVTLPGLSQVTTLIEKVPTTGQQGCSTHLRPGLGAGGGQEERSWGGTRGIPALVLQAGGWSPGEVYVGESKEAVCDGTSLVVQWLRLRLPMQGVWVRSLVGELRSHMPPGQKTET